jgi:MoxR-like ATPase
VKDSAGHAPGILLLIEGPPGAGKTELARAARAAAGRAEIRPLEARGSELEQKTVERHLSSARQKLGIWSRFQLAAAIGE